MSAIGIVQDARPGGKFPLFKFRNGPGVICFLKTIIIRGKIIVPVYSELFAVYTTRNQIIIASDNFLAIIERRYPFVHMCRRTKESDED